MFSITIRKLPLSFGMHCGVPVDGVQVDGVQVDGVGFSCTDPEGEACSVIWKMNIGDGDVTPDPVHGGRFEL